MPTLNNYSGISISLAGTEGVDWMPEYLCSDQSIQPRSVIAIKAATAITLTQNANNNVATAPIGSGSYVTIGTGYMGNPANQGVIRMRVDRDSQKGAFKFSNGDTGGLSPFPVYPGPFAFSSLEYAPGVAVIGTTGETGGTWNTANRATHYFRGHLDYSGEEWHAIDWWDDDSNWLPAIFAANHFDDEGDPIQVKAEYLASDGKTQLFVTVPKAPWQKFTATGTAEFWTSEPKAFDTPKIHQQRTVICCGNSGSISVELRDLYARNIFYRIVTDPMDGVTAYTAVGADNITLTESSFPVGTRYLQYYSTGLIANVKTREVLRIQNTPAATDFPSNGEGHGAYGVGNAARWTAIASSVNQVPYAAAYSKLKTDNGATQFPEWDASEATPGSRRWPWGTKGQAEGGSALRNALVAKLEGFTYTKSGATKSFGQYAIEMMLRNESARTDPVGFEKSHSDGAHPSTEQIGAGYYAAHGIFNTMWTYDIVAGYFRCDQVTGGLTPIQDYAFRESAMKWAYQGAYLLMNSVWPDLGLWGTARVIAGFCAAALMPKYTSPVLGTSGFDGVTTTVYTLCPFPDDGYTYFTLFATRPTPPKFYPNLALRLNPDTSDLNRSDRWGGPNLGYASLMIECFDELLWLQSLFAPLTDGFPNMRACIGHAIAGTLIGTGTTSNWTDYYPQYQPHIRIGNGFVDALGGPSVAAIKSPPAPTAPIPTTPKTEAATVLEYLETAIMRYDRTTPAAGTVADPVISVPSGAYESARTVVITCGTILATIRYTTDGNDPTSGSTAYTVPLNISTNTVLKARAFKVGSTDSGVTTSTVTFLPAGQPSAPINFEMLGFI